MLVQRIRWSTLFLLLVTVFLGASPGCAGDEPPDELEPIAKAAQPVNNGVLDNGQLFSATVSLRYTRAQDGRTTGCSGTLVTPRWVMTARHCFDEEGDIDQDVRVFTGVAGADEVAHTFDASDPTTQIKLMQPPFERTRDIALIRLDEPIPLQVAEPSPPPTVPYFCGTDFSGVLVGYSDEGFRNYGYDCPDPPDGARRFALSTHWDRFEDDIGRATFTKAFSGPHGEACDWFNGINHGDSGGSLYRHDNFQFCGVISGQDQFGVFDHYCGAHGLLCLPNDTRTEFIDGNTAAVDEPDAIAFWSDHLLDINGNFEGACPDPTSQNDPDGDEIPTVCDNCPLVWNPDQIHSDGADDDDGDGVGNECDLCPDAPNSLAALNKNLEIELAVAYPELDAPPLPLRRDDFSSLASFIVARDAYLAAFRPDVCDKTPVPLQEINVPGALPDGAINYPIDDSNCELSLAGCETTIKNKIELRSFKSVADDSSGETATVGLRWCDCQLAPEGSSDRNACRRSPMLPCTYDEDFYMAGGAGNNWVEIETSGNPNFPNPQVGDEWPLSVDFHPPPNDKIVAYWNFGALPPGSLQVETNLAEVDGILWAHYTELTDYADGFDQERIRRFANSLSSGNAFSFRHSGQQDQWFYAPDYTLCPIDCVHDIGNIFLEVGNPQWVLADDASLRPIARPSASTVQYYERVATGQALHVAASESLYRLQAMTPPSETILRSVGIEGGQVANVLSSGRSRSSAPGDVLPSVQAASIPLPVAITPGVGVALSSSEQSLFLLAGNTGHILDLESGAAALGSGVTALQSGGASRTLNLPAGESFGTVLATAYRAEDQGVYFLAKVGNQLQLRRWYYLRRFPEGGAVRTLATFPKKWNGYQRYRLTLGPTGDIGVVAWRVGRSGARFLRFAVDKANRLTIAGYAKRKYDVVADPVLGFDAFVFSKRPFAHDDEDEDEDHDMDGHPHAGKQPRATFISLSGLHAPPGKAKPTLLAH